MGMEISSGQPVLNVGGYGNNGMWGGEGGLMFLAFLAMMGGFGGGGMWGGRGVPNNVATTDTVNQAMNYSNLQQQNSQIMAEIQRSNNASMMFGADKYMELQRDIANNGSQIQAVLAQLNQCCCTLQRQIDAQVLDQTKQNYELRISMDKQFCDLNKRLDADENQRLRDKVENLQDDMRMFRLMLGNGNGCGSNFGFGFNN